MLMRYKFANWCLLIIMGLAFHQASFAQHELDNIIVSEVIYACYEKNTMQVELTIQGDGVVNYTLSNKLSGAISFELHTRIYHYYQIAEIIVNSTIQESKNSSDAFIFAKTETTQIEINYTISDNLEFHSYLSRIADHISGRELEVMAWLVDFQIAVLESFPEQFRVDLIVQRGTDFLTVVLEGEVNLTVYNMQISKEQKIYEVHQLFQIASGGKLVEIKFPTFTLGTEYRPENLVFVFSFGDSVLTTDWFKKQDNEKTDINSSIQVTSPITTITNPETPSERTQISSIHLSLNSSSILSGASRNLPVSGFFVITVILTSFCILIIRRTKLSSL